LDGDVSDAAPIRINLALQGGGAHGAYTWGVLDRFLDEPDLEIAGMSGTSAGALNGAAVKAGLLADGRAGAKAALREVWEQVSGGGLSLNPGLREWFGAVLPDAGTISKTLENSPFWLGLDALSRMTSPYATGPFYRHPLRPIVDRLDFTGVCAKTGPALFVSATNVRTGKVRVFDAAELTTDVILASACLPTLFRAVEIHDPSTRETEAYWDGGYTGNPALFPLFEPSLPDDIIIVNINPLYRAEVPRTAPAIQNRINEISFNSSLLSELRAIGFVKRLIADGTVQRGAMKDVLVHMIADDTLMSDLGVATKSVPVPLVIERLHDAGRRAAGRFLRAHKQDLGKRTTVDLALAAS
jgi:NTE family protein